MQEKTKKNARAHAQLTRKKKRPGERHTPTFYAQKYNFLLVWIYDFMCCAVVLCCVCDTFQIRCFFRFFPVSVTLLLFFFRFCSFFLMYSVKKKNALIQKTKRKKEKQKYVSGVFGYPLCKKTSFVFFLFAGSLCVCKCAFTQTYSVFFLSVCYCACVCV